MPRSRDHWSSRLGFVLAAAGSAVGLGNLWKFPYITWSNSGGAFVLVYLVCVLAVGLPIMMAEILIGRHTQKSPVGAMAQAVGPAWSLVGGLGVLTGFIILAYYTVIAGWTLRYFWLCLGWSTGGFDSQKAASLLIEKTGIVTTPGSGLGPSGEGYLRFSLITDNERLEEAVQRMKSIL